MIDHVTYKQIKWKDQVFIISWGNSNFSGISNYCKTATAGELAIVVNSSNNNFDDTDKIHR